MVTSKGPGRPPTLMERLRFGVSELDRARVQERFAGLPLVPVAEAEERVPVRIGGEVRSVQVAAPTSAPYLEVTVTDGTGSALIRFSGRRRIAGISAGRALVVEGVGRRTGDRLLLRDPAYTLLP